jgi:RNA polymerase sigma factor (sigma-70 family)
MTDGQLLEWFVTQRDEAAFEALVRRHGPMVLGVCSRVLRNRQDAEDAFQATFLVLVRKAAGIGRGELLGNWLYGVAHRTALDARAANTRRRVREKQVRRMPEPEARDGTELAGDLRSLLDQELNRLPDKYRVAVVLCDLEARTRREAARQLGVPVRTLSGRLTTARRLLAKRLARRGLAFSSGAFMSVLSQSTGSASVPSPLLAKAVETAVAGATGRVTAEVASVKVAALAEGALKAMWVKKLKMALAALLAVGIVTGAAVVIVPTHRGAGDAEAPRIIQLDARGRRVIWSPDGKSLAVVTKVEKTFLGFQYDRKGSAIRFWDVEKGQVRQILAEDTGKGLAFQQVVFSVDGNTIAATVSEMIRQPNVLMIRDVVKVWDAKTLALKQTLGGDSSAGCLALSPDGSLVAVGDPGKKTVKLWNVGMGVLERTLKTGAAQPWSVAFSPDGKTLVVGGQKDDHSGEVQVWDTGTWTLKHVLKRDKYVNTVAFSANGMIIAGGSDAVQLWDARKGKLILSFQGVGSGTRSVAFSPDGQAVAAGCKDGKIRLWDVRTGKVKGVLEGHGAEIYSVAFSPNGKTLASVSQDQTLRLWPINTQASGE